jgi:formiminoglutamase
MLVEIVRGDGPVILGLPHTGTWLPDDVFARLNPLGQALADTDPARPRCARSSTAI